MTCRRNTPHVVRALCLLLFCWLAVDVHAQSNSGEIAVEVKDGSGASMQASGSLIPAGGGQTRRFTTDLQGVYLFSAIPPGNYKLQVSQAGFAAASVDVVVRANSRAKSIVTLPLTMQATTVQVTTPLASDNVVAQDLAKPVQTASSRDIEAAGAIDLSDFLNKRLDSVYVNEVQGNPFQPDVNYRGYTASPLLGTSQGISVYMDGVRLNQPFGDVVSWDLVPKLAVSEVSLIPGSDPLFGLNTLGGALSIRTKDGLTNPGTTVQLSGGSFGRKAAEAEHGGLITPTLNYYLAGNLFFEDGWRSASPSNVRQFFGKLGWQREKTTLNFSTSYANNSLIGNGLQEQRLLARDYRSIYTKPDVTANRSPFLNLSGRHSVNSSLNFSGNAYYRYIRTRTLNGDINEDSLSESVYQPTAADQQALLAAGITGFPTSGANATNTPFPRFACIAQVLRNAEPAEKCNGLLNRTGSEQHNYGFFGQMGWTTTPGGHRNQLIVGGGYDRSNLDFSQTSQLGYLNPDRGVTGVNAFGDGVTGGNADGVPYDTRVNLDSRVRTGSFYAADIFKIRDDLTLNISGRYNHTNINNRDRITPGGLPGSLDGNHSFQRLNPLIGLTYSPFRFLGAYASYSQSSRAPTAIELGCADPNTPCRLPNALAGDPPLNQVVTRTWEAGLRGGQESRFGWSAGWFRAENRNDLLFVSSTQTGFGYFKNFGLTKRQGAEVNLRGRIKRLTIGGGYTFLDATYQTSEVVDGSSNSANEEALEGEPGVEGTITIQPGNQIPLTPRHLLKAYADIQITSRLTLDLNEIAVSKSFARGNENNLSQIVPPYYLGPGQSPGYALLNIGLRYRAARWAEFFSQINNVFNRRYYTGAQLGGAGFSENGAFAARPFPQQNGEYPLPRVTFYAPGAPIGVWAGIRFRF